MESNQQMKPAERKESELSLFFLPWAAVDEFMNQWSGEEKNKPIRPHQAPKSARQAEMESNKRNGNEISFVDGIEGRLGLVSFFGGYGLVGQPMLRKEKKRAPTSPTTHFFLF